MRILGIESSCDDTSVALLDCSNKGHFVLNEKTASQIDIHQKYGGVVPEIAGRAHAEKIVPLIEAVLKPTKQFNNLTIDQFRPDAIAVTSGPGLITGLIVGVEAARTLAYAWDLPLIGVNHIAGHVHSVEIQRDPSAKPQDDNKKSTTYNPGLAPRSGAGLQRRTHSAKRGRPTTSIEFPALALVVSGGHTELILMQSHTDYKIIGKTKDDAAGECFDKVAKMLDLPYPGGPEISRLAGKGNPRAIDFPRPMLKEKIDFSAKGGPAFGWSFAGLKTSALYWLRDPGALRPGNPPGSLRFGRDDNVKTQDDNGVTINDFCASVEQAIVDVLVAKTVKAAKEFKPKTIILAGGVSANKKLRETLNSAVKKDLPNTLYLIPNTSHSMDNGAMIAVAGYYQAKAGNYTPWQKLDVNPNWKVDQ